MKKTFLIALVTFSAVLFSFSQSVPAPCGTGDYISEWLDKYQANPALYPKSDQLLYLPLTIHIVGTGEGEGYFEIHKLYDALCRLNSDFEPVNLQFFIEGDINYINNSAYYDHNYSQGQSMMFFYNVSNTINCYIVDSPAGNCGYYSGSRDAVALAKSCLDANDKTWSHEVGHMLSLPHTFRGWENSDEEEFDTPAPVFTGSTQVEKADGSNCAVAADRFCDTPADYLHFRWSCAPGDTLSAIEQIDPEGMAFHSDGTLIMSYSNDNCAYRFSDEQTAAMRANVENQRTNMLYDQSERFPITESTQLITPLSGTTISNPETLTLEWTASENVEYYFLQIDKNPSFNTADLQEIFLSTTTYNLTLEPNRPYFWRVRPLSDYYGCTNLTSYRYFITDDLSTSTSSIAQLDGWSVYPNPVAGQTLNISIQANTAFEVNPSLWNGIGQQVANFGIENIRAGNNDLQVELPVLPKGIYWLVLQANGERNMHKIVINNQ